MSQIWIFVVYFSGCSSILHQKPCGDKCTLLIITKIRSIHHRSDVRILHTDIGNICSVWCEDELHFCGFCRSKYLYFRLGLYRYFSALMCLGVCIDRQPKYHQHSDEKCVRSKLHYTPAKRDTISIFLSMRAFILSAPSARRFSTKSMFCSSFARASWIGRRKSSRTSRSSSFACP